jgi:hypothetical protein
MEQEKIKYSQLSWSLKLAVIAAWISGLILILGFIDGFIKGALY